MVHLPIYIYSLNLLLGKLDDAIEVKGRKHYEIKESKGALDRPGIRVLRPDYSRHHV